MLKTGTFLLAASLAIPGCFRDNYREPENTNPPIAQEQPVQTPGIPHTEYHFDDVVRWGGKSSRHSPEKIRFYETDDNRVNVLEVVYTANDSGTRYFANDDLKLFKGQRLRKGEITSEFEIDLNSEDPEKLNGARRIQREFNNYIEKIKKLKSSSSENSSQ